MIKYKFIKIKLVLNKQQNHTPLETADSQTWRLMEHKSLDDYTSALSKFIADIKNAEKQAKAVKYFFIVIVIFIEYTSSKAYFNQRTSTVHRRRGSCLGIFQLYYEGCIYQNVVCFYFKTLVLTLSLIILQRL